MKKFWIILGCAVYVIVPVDLLPEAIFLLLGYADDLVVVLMTLNSLSNGSAKHLPKR